MRVKACGLIFLCIFFVAAPAHAALLLDLSPVATGGTIAPGGGWIYENRADTQNFAERILFDYDAYITGMSIYTYSYFAGGAGREVAVKRWWETGAAPDPSGLTRFDAVLSAIDTEGIGPYNSGSQAGWGVQAYADFGANSFLLPANTPLWIGMSGRYFSYASAPVNLGLFGLTGLASPADGMMWQFSGDTSLDLTPAGDMAMRIYGDPVTSAVPEPASLLLLGTGLGALAGVLRRKKRASLR